MLLDNNVIVIDDVIPEKSQVLLENALMGPETPWYSHQTSVTYDDTSPQFVHMLWENNAQSSPLFPLFLPVLSAFPFKYNEIMRVKANLKFRNSFVDTGSPHVDAMMMAKNFISVVYYVNDSDGDTVIYDQHTGYAGELTVKERVSPKRGRLVAFDGRLLHSAGAPKECAARLIINTTTIAISDK